MSRRPKASIEDEVLKLAAALEAGSEHPLAEAILRGAEARGLKPGKTEGFDSITGQGVKGRVDGREVLLGNQRLLQEAGIDASPLASAAEARRKQGETVVFLSAGGKFAGIVAVADPIKSISRRGHRQAACAWAAHRHGDRRQRDHGPRRG